MRTDVSGYLPHPGEQTRVVEPGLVGGDAVPLELSGLSYQASRVGERSYWDGPIVGGHAAQVSMGDERSPSSEARGAQGRDDARRSAA